MAWAVYFMVLLSSCSGVISQPTLTQPASQSVSLGQTIKISCTASSSVSYIDWYQQSPGQAPRFVHCDACSSRGSGIPDRFTASRSGTTGYLTITGSQTEDDANYYCAAWFGSPSTIVFGGGTHLTVTGQPAVSPLVILFPPSKEQMQTRNEATLACLMDGFTPRTISVQWTADGSNISDGVETSTAVKQSDNNGYLASSYLTLSSTKWQSYQEVGCKVTHEGKLIEKTVRRSDVPS